MKTAMQELRDVIEQMINNGGTEEDLFAVIAHIDNWGFEIENKQIMDAYNQGTLDGESSILQYPNYYNQTYNQNK